MEIKGYKVFNPDWTCNGFQYEVGKTYEEDVSPSVCRSGFHFCKRAVDCFNYYPFDPLNKVAEVIALGEIEEEGDKCCTNKIKIVREITWEEVLALCNTGKACTGLCNSGNCNSGNSNSGNWNSGDRNSGSWNSGDRNSGKWNSGDWNSGDRNSGSWNSGNRNSGDHNSGNCNTGDFNTGNWNQGDFCTGDCNKASNVVGCFNTQSQKLRFFDKETDMTFEEWRNSEAYRILCKIPFEPTRWIWADGGYLKVCDTKKAFLTWWDGLTEDEKNIIKNIPNFDAGKFYKITGIKVE